MARNLKQEKLMQRQNQQKHSSVERPQYNHAPDQEITAGHYQVVGNYPGNGIINH